MAARRTLSLKKETLAQLGPDDLRAVNGAFPTGTSTWAVPTVYQCPLDGTGYYLTVPVTGCVSG
jgi:hypothetical protein